MSLTFTQPQNPGVSPAAPAKPAPGQKPDKPQPTDPQMKNLQHQKEMLDKKIERLQPKKPLADAIRDAAGKLAADPNDDPQDLYRQVRPLLNTLRLANVVQNNKTRLMPNTTNSKGLQQYMVTLRRLSPINFDILKRLYAEKDSWDTISWNAEGICIYLWYEYKAPEVTGPAGPTAPGMTPAP